MQKSFSDLEFAAKKKLTRRERFLGEIDALVPWTQLMAVIEPFYPKCGKRGRPPVGLERMLRLYVVQHCFARSDEGIEDAVYDSQSIRRFAAIDLAHEDAPDSTTVLHFRHLLERPSGKARADGKDFCSDQGSSGGQRPASQGRHHRRCHDHFGAHLDEERQVAVQSVVPQAQRRA